MINKKRKIFLKFSSMSKMYELFDNLDIFDVIITGKNYIRPKFTLKIVTLHKFFECNLRFCFDEIRAIYSSQR